MKRSIVVIIVCAILFSSCNQQKKALAFNDKIANLSNQLTSKGKELGPILQTAIQSRDFKPLIKPTEELQKITTDDLAEISAMDNVAGSENLKSVSLDYFKYEKKLIEEGLVPFKSMNSSTTPDAINAATQKLMTAANDEQSYLEKVQAAQDEYGKKNGFSIAAK
jgi:hypothetical protein